MFKNRKRGQIQISFGMIFSIIIVIVTIAVGFYVINYFLNLKSCTQIGLFWDSLRNEVDKAWNSDMTETVFNGNLPSGIKKVCFGNFTQSYSAIDGSEYLALKKYSAAGRNAYLYPPGKACDVAFNNLKHARTDEFFCVSVISGKMKVKLSKTSFEPLVKLSKP